jgi:hypothetical protein
MVYIRYGLYGYLTYGLYDYGVKGYNTQLKFKDYVIVVVNIVCNTLHDKSWQVHDTLELIFP